jgi:MerR family transcriptional regulator, light-induced transcriptional regulator
MPSYPIRAVAQITGLSLDTLRAWERRYKAVVPERSHRGRQYGAEHIERLLLLGRLVEKGHAIGGIASLSDEGLQKLLNDQPRRPVSQISPDASTMIAPILAAIEEFDMEVASQEMSRLAAMLAPRDLVYQVMVPLMHEVGVRWHEGKLAIAQQHLVSQMLRDLLGSIIRLFRPSGSKVRMVFATPAGESHEFGIQAASALASMMGIEPVYLGTNLPAAEIAQAAQRTAAQVIVLGITLPSESTAAEISSVAAAMPATTELWLGGGGSGIDVAVSGPSAVRLDSLPAFELQCRRFQRLGGVTR